MYSLKYISWVLPGKGFVCVMGSAYLKMEERISILKELKYTNPGRDAHKWQCVWGEEERWRNDEIENFWEVVMLAKQGSEVFQARSM